MVELSVVALRLPDGRVVLQRRTRGARVSPGKLGFFGGHREPGETSLETLKRELKEETSLEADNLPLHMVDEFTMESDANEGTLHFTLYEAALESVEFEVYEGQRAEAYRIKEALSRDDLTPSVRFAFEKYWRDEA